MPAVDLKTWESGGGFEPLSSAVVDASLCVCVRVFFLNKKI
jgi:hypothetical protein